MSHRDFRLNTPAEMWVRFVFAVRYLLLLGGLLFGVVALRDNSVVDGLNAAGCLTMMMLGHQWLKSRGKLEECDRALDAMFSGEGAADENTGLDALIERREALEERRGQPGFDPWEVQAVRREIGDYLREHPECKREFDGP